MAVTSLYRIISVLLFIAASSASPVQARVQTASRDVRKEAGDLVTKVTQLVRQARTGSTLSHLHRDVTDTQTRALALVAHLQRPATECETRSVLKMAASGVGSQEVLSLLVSRGVTELLSSQLDMALALMIQIVRQMEADLVTSTDMTSHLTALVFAANLTASAVARAEKSFSNVTSGATSDLAPARARVRRQSPVLTGNLAVDIQNLDIARPQVTGLNSLKPANTKSLDLGGGFSLQHGGLNWQSPSGQWSFSATPSFSGPSLNGGRLGASFTFGGGGGGRGGGTEFLKGSNTLDEQTQK